MTDTLKKDQTQWANSVPANIWTGTFTTPAVQPPNLKKITMEAREISGEEYVRLSDVLEQMKALGFELKRETNP